MIVQWRLAVAALLIVPWACALGDHEGLRALLVGVLPDGSLLYPSFLDKVEEA